MATNGTYLVADGDIELNAGRPTATLVVANTGDRPVHRIRPVLVPNPP